MLVVVLVEKAQTDIARSRFLWAQKAGLLLTECGHEVRYFDLSEEEPVLSLTLDLASESKSSKLHPSHYLKALSLPEFRKADLIINTTFSGLADPGRLEGLIEMYGLRSLGNPSKAIAASCDRTLMRTLAQASLKAIPTLSVQHTYSAQLLEEIVKLGPQVLLRKNYPFNSPSILIQTNAVNEIQGLLDEALEEDAALTIESFIPGRFFSVAIVGKRALSCREFHYQPTSTPREMIESTLSYSPSHMPSGIQAQMQQHARHLHNLLGCHHLSECDFHLGADGTLHFIHFNAQPLAKNPSIFLEVLQAHGLSNASFLQHMIDLSLAQSVHYPLSADLSANVNLKNFL